WYLGCGACLTPSSVAECKSALQTASTLTPTEVERALLEFLLHYADRILPIEFLPDRGRTSAGDYAEATSTLAASVIGALSQSDRQRAARARADAASPA